MTYIENERFRVGAVETGAELSSFIDRGEELLWQGGEIWNGRSPLLFPVVGRLREDTYCLGEKTYVIPKHGFSRKAQFALESSSKDEMTFLLTDSAETRGCFPFPFELRVHYFFAEGGFVMEHRVKNTGDETMYFSIGAHPGFQCAMGDKVVMDEMETAAAFRLDENGLRAEKQTPVFDASREVVVTPDVFADDALIFDGLKSRGCALERADGRRIHVDFGGAP